MPARRVLCSSMKPAGCWVWAATTGSPGIRMATTQRSSRSLLTTFAAMDSLVCGTRNGAQIMGLGDEIGTLEMGKLADLLVVAGDVLADISILESRSNLAIVMQGGITRAGTRAEFTPTVLPSR
jgi:imidazolonepropionase-like amidohydrolase